MLPDDARFCHKCGKPQRDEPLLAEQPAPPPLPAAPKFPPIGLGNGLAVRIALLGSASALVISLVSVPLLTPLVFLLWLVIAGFFCVAAYRRRTGQRLSMVNGAHLGWICGLFVFVLMGLMFTVSVMSDPGSLASDMEAMRSQLNASARPGIDVNQIMEAMRSPAGILFGFLGAFLLLTALPACGGAIGAKLLDRE
jgi:pheromone shutdown protein TraB